VFYRIPTVAEQIKNGKLDAFTPYPGFAIEAMTNEGKWLPITQIQYGNEIQSVRAKSAERVGRSLLMDK
jgi:hexosaminidase